MRYAFFGTDDRIVDAHNDDTLDDLPAGAIKLTDDQWQDRFDLRLQDGNVINDPIVTATADIIEAETIEINALRDRHAAGGFLVGGYWFHSDQQSLTRYLALRQLGLDLQPREWKTMNGSLVSMTPDLAAQVFFAAIAHDGACFDAGEMHKKALAESADPAAYDYSVGWPSMYTGSI